MQFWTGVILLFSFGSEIWVFRTYMGVIGANWEFSMEFLQRPKKIVVTSKCKCIDQNILYFWLPNYFSAVKKRLSRSSLHKSSSTKEPLTSIWSFHQSRIYWAWKIPTTKMPLAERKRTTVPMTQIPEISYSNLKINRYDLLGTREDYAHRCNSKLLYI